MTTEGARVEQGYGEDWTDIGRRIRAARIAAGVSVRELGRRVNVSPSHISQVERGLGSFSVSALYSVASQLAISLDSLFDAPRAAGAARETPPSALDGTAVLRAADRPAIKLKSGPRWERLTVHPEPDAEFLEVIYEAASDDVEGEFSRHEGIEYGVVISGALSVQVGFDSTVLYPGDSIRIDSSQPHRYWNAGQGQVRAIWFESRSLDSVKPHSSGRSHGKGALN
jgi:transcriptional regulator with XRE-family HTH domain